jgi:DNA-binding transcriptional LysR family regulator
MQTTTDLAIIVALADTCSLTEAARICGVTRATVTRRLDALEQDMGVALLNRSTRSLSLTEAGTVYVQSCRGALEHLRRAEASVRELDGVPRGQLRVAAPIIRLEGIVGPLVTGFALRHPTVEVQIVVSSEHVDPIADQFDVAVRVGGGTNPTLITRCLARETFGLYASPEYLARRGTPRSPAELEQHDCLAALREGARESWPLSDGGSLSIARPRLLANSSSLIRLGALGGLGIGLIAGSLVRDDLAAGTLKPVLRDEVGQELPVSLLYAESAKTSAKVRCFVEHALEWVKQYT